MLDGPPGNGKTTLAEAIACETMLPFYVVRYEGVVASFLGETASRLDAVFDFARTRRCVLFLDEFDSIAKERSDAHETGEIKRVVSTLLLQIDRLPAHVVVVCSTNHSELLDRAAWRRFQLRLELDAPTRTEATEFLEKLRIRLGGDLGLASRTLADKLLGASYAELEQDVDPAEIGKVRKAEVPIVGDAKVVLGQLLEALAKRLGDTAPPVRADWLATLAGWQRDHPLSYQQQPEGPIQQQYVIEELHRLTGGDAIVVAGVGQHQMWASQFWGFERPNTWINSGGLGTMGYAVPAAVGAKAGRPDQVIFAIDGDGCFQMTFQELITASVEGIPIKVAVMNNGSLGMVKQWQRLFYNERYSAVDLTDHTPDYVKLAEAMGCAGLRAEHPAEVRPTLEKALAIDDRPVVIDFKCDPDAMVFPMIPAGGSNDNVILTPEDL